MNMHVAMVLTVHLQAAADFEAARAAYWKHQAQRPANYRLLDDWIEQDSVLFDAYVAAAQAVEELRAISPIGRYV